MPIALLVPEYFSWHYTSALKLAVNIVTNFLWFTYHFFSIPVLSRTLFDPFEPGRIEGDLGLPPVLFDSFLIVVGFAVRVITLAFGLALCTVVIAFGAFFVAVWFFAPLITTALIVKAFALLV